MDSDDILDSRLDIGFDSPTALEHRARTTAVLFDGVEGLDAPAEAVLETLQTHANRLRSRLSSASAVHLAVGRTAQDFVALAYMDSVLQRAGRTDIPVFWLSASVQYPPSIAEYPADPRLCEAAAWTEVPPATRSDARRFWIAATSPSPHELNRLWKDAGASSAVGVAARALINRFPSRSTGLSSLELQVLNAVVDGPKTQAQLLECIRAKAPESDPATTSSTLHAMRRLTEQPRPLLHMPRPPSFGAHEVLVSATAAGRSLSRGDIDASPASTTTRWVGGVMVSNEGHQFWARRHGTVTRLR